jgi:hypothetical protein
MVAKASARSLTSRSRELRGPSSPPTADSSPSAIRFAALASARSERLRALLEISDMPRVSRSAAMRPLLNRRMCRSASRLCRGGWLSSTAPTTAPSTITGLLT